MQDGVRFSICQDDHGIVELRVEARAKGFSGAAAAWLEDAELERFARELDVFPLSATEPPTLSGGIWPGVGGENRVVFVAVTVRPTDSRGGLAAVVWLAADMGWPREEPELQPRAHVVVRTDYAAVQRFAREIPRLVRGEVAEAVLEAAR